MPDPYGKLMKPDFGSDLPEWLNMGGDQSQPDVSPFVSALKKRMATKPEGGMGAGMGDAASAMGSMGSSGGMESL